MKRVFALLLAVTVAVMLSVTAFADVLVQYGDWLMTKIEYDSAFEVRGYQGTDTAIMIPDKISKTRVISIGSMAFYQDDTVVSVGADGLLQQIQEYAFLEAAALQSVNLPYCVYRIDRGAFRGTAALQSINLEDTCIESVSESAFQDSGIGEITLPGSCTSIGVSAFRNCKSLTKITIPDSVTAIADSAFDGCDSLVIYAASDSYAIAYAKAHDINYVCTDVEGITYLIGDSDGDGSVTIVDATLIQRVLVELEYDADGMITLRADSVGDGLDILDATRIQRFLADMYVTTTLGTYAFHPLT